MAEWGRKEYSKKWPSRTPVWTWTAVLGSMVFFAGMLTLQYERSWSAAERLYLTDYLKSEPFSLDYLTEMVRGYVEKSGVGKQGACHLFRHTMATLMLEGGADIRFIQAMLGHADLKTTQIYTHVAIRQLQEIHRATHPAKLPRTEPEDE
jgi:integrase